MRRNYSEPKFEVLALGEGDVIVTSGDVKPQGPDENGAYTCPPGYGFNPFTITCEPDGGVFD